MVGGRIVLVCGRDEVPEDVIEMYIDGERTAVAEADQATR